MNERRQFIRSLFRSAVKTLGTVKSSLQPAEVTSYNNEQLAELIPVIPEAKQLRLDDNGRLYRLDSDAAPSQPLYYMTPEHQCAYRLFDGEKTIRGIAQQLAVECRLSADEAFTQVRALFTNLYTLGICIPKNS